MHDQSRPEQESANHTYQRAARYNGSRAKEDAKRAYKRSRRDLHHAPEGTEISVFRLQIGNLIEGVAYLGWYVALIGTPPDQALTARLEDNLADGTEVQLPAVVLEMLHERREHNSKLAPWIERHHGRVTQADLYQRPTDERNEGLARRQR